MALTCWNTTDRPRLYQVRMPDREYVTQIDELLTSDNPFAMVTAAHLLTQRTRRHPKARYRWKQKVVRSLYAKGWDKQAILDLFAIIDWMMHLPRDLVKQFQLELTAYEEEKHMRYVTSVEQLAKEEGMLAGEIKGKREGMLAGEKKGKAASLERLLEFKFGECPSWAKDKLYRAEEEQLDGWLERILGAKDVDSIFK